MLSCVINMNKTQKYVSYLFAYTIKREEKNCRWISVSGCQRFRFQPKENSDTVLHSKLQILKIRRNTFLIHSYPGNTLDTLKRIPNLGGIDIRTVLLKYPKILMSNTNTLLEISNILKEFEIDDTAVQRCMELFTLSSENVRQRLHELKRVPEFDVYMKHPRALRLVHYIPEVRSRLQTIQGMKMQCISLHMLSSSRRIFKKYTEVGENRTRGQDLIIFLSGELNAPENFIHDKLREHPYWCRISLVAIKETLQHLKSNGYSIHDILSNVQLLLYPRNKINEELNTMMNRSEVVAAINMKKKSTISQDNCISKSQSLAMCFYFLEREHHFTGNGVWTNSPY